jgi:hypothetical protein
MSATGKLNLNLDAGCVGGTKCGKAKGPEVQKSYLPVRSAAQVRCRLVYSCVYQYLSWWEYISHAYVSRDTLFLNPYCLVSNSCLGLKSRDEPTIWIPELRRRRFKAKRILISRCKPCSTLLTI